MDQSEKQEIAETLSKVLDKHRGVDAKTHEKHHEYIDVCISEIDRKRIFWQGVRKQVFGWGIIMALSGVGLAVADYVQHVLKIK